MSFEIWFFLILVINFPRAKKSYFLPPRSLTGSADSRRHVFGFESHPLRGRDTEITEDASENEVQPVFSEPVLMTEFGLNKRGEPRFVYNYPKQTVLSFEGQGEKRKLFLKRKDKVFSKGLTLANYNVNERDEDVAGEDDTKQSVVDSICVYSARMGKNSTIEGVVSLCEQRIEGAVMNSDGAYRLWTEVEVASKNAVTMRYFFAKERSNPNSNFEVDTADDEEIDPTTLKNLSLLFEKVAQSEKTRQAAPAGATNIVTRFVEVYILVDKDMSDSFDGDQKKVQQKVTGMIGFLNEFYRPFNIKFLIIHVEYQFDVCGNNPTGVAKKDVITYLNCVKKYRADQICAEPNGPMKRSDHTLALTGLSFCDDNTCIKGVAKLYTICSWENSVSLSSAGKKAALWESGLTLAHELGHSFGANHDWGIKSKSIKTLLNKAGNRPAKCSCKQPDGSIASGETKRCLMSPIIDTTLTWTWSDCSFADMDFSYRAHLHRCLTDRNDGYIELQRMMQGTCGNGIVEPGEQCENMGTGCCGTNCLLKEGAECNEGACCKDCRLEAKGTVCRPKLKDVCDTDDVCDGKSPQCDVRHKPNGTPCKTKEWETAFCYRGACRSQTNGCQDLYGKNWVANMEMMKYPLKAGGGKQRAINGCRAKPCVFAIKKSWTVRKLLTEAMEPCPNEGAALCGTLICRPKTGRMRRSIQDVGAFEKKEEEEELRNAMLTRFDRQWARLRVDFFDVMKDRYGNKKWLRMLERSGLMETHRTKRIREGASTDAEKADLVKGYSNRFVMNVYRGKSEKFVYFPLHKNNPALAPSGSPCANSSVCHNGRCISVEQFVNETYDPANEPLEEISNVVVVKENCTAPDLLSYCSSFVATSVILLVIVIILCVYIYTVADPTERFKSSIKIDDESDEENEIYLMGVESKGQAAQAAQAGQAGYR